jgi:3-phenylpropionate/cinnamic acid dioxygenase small subunit
VTNILDGHRADGRWRLELRKLRSGIDAFNAAYAYTLDKGDIADWPGFFTDAGRYRITARENFEADLPIGLIYCDGMGMLIDRASAIAQTTTFAPRYLSHINSGVFVKGVDAAGAIHTSTNYVILQTLMEVETTVLQAGEYID